MLPPPQLKSTLVLESESSPHETEEPGYEATPHNKMFVSY